MKKNTAFPLSLQREIEKRRLNVESEINKSINELGVRNLLQQSRIRKQKGVPTVSLLFILLVLPIIKQSLSAVWCLGSTSKISFAHTRGQKTTTATMTA